VDLVKNSVLAGRNARGAWAKRSKVLQNSVKIVTKRSGACLQCPSCVVYVTDPVGLRSGDDREGDYVGYFKQDRGDIVKARLMEVVFTCALGPRQWLHEYIGG